MSISSKAIAMYGIYFSNNEEALSFCQKFYPEMKEVENLPASAEVRRNAGILDRSEVWP